MAGGTSCGVARVIGVRTDSEFYRRLQPNPSPPSSQPPLSHPSAVAHLSRIVPSSPDRTPSTSVSPSTVTLPGYSRLQLRRLARPVWTSIPWT
jgi:hypothetical protein